jgi:hypothetical protein
LKRRFKKPPLAESGKVRPHSSVKLIAPAADLINELYIGLKGTMVDPALVLTPPAVATFDSNRLLPSRQKLAPVAICQNSEAWPRAPLRFLLTAIGKQVRALHRRPAIPATSRAIQREFFQHACSRGISSDSISNGSAGSKLGARMRRITKTVMLGMIVISLLAVGISTGSGNVLDERDSKRWGVFNEEILERQQKLSDKTSGATNYEYDTNCLDNINYQFNDLSRDVDEMSTLVYLSVSMVDQSDEAFVNKILQTMVITHQKMVAQKKYFINLIQGRCPRSSITNAYAQELINLIDRAAQMRLILLNKVGN